jgi:transposase
MEGGNVQDTEAGVHGGVQGLGREAGEIRGDSGAVARDLGLVEQTLRNWVKAAKAGKLHAPGAKMVTPEQMELSRVRAENARLRMEVEILKKATAYFAKDAQ